jgi:hypothetical protein
MQLVVAGRGSFRYPFLIFQRNVSAPPCEKSDDVLIAYLSDNNQFLHACRGFAGNGHNLFL